MCGLWTAGLTFSRGLLTLSARLGNGWRGLGVIVRVSGVKRVRNAKNGRTYFYHRRSGKRIAAEPNSAAFILEVGNLDGIGAPKPEKEAGSWGALVTAYRRSPEYKQ